MKRFEFTLARVLDVRRKQADIAVAHLTTLNSRLAALQQEELSVQQQLVAAQVAVKEAGASMGNDLAALARFGDHTRNRMANVQARRSSLRQEIATQTEAVVEADRAVKLLENLEQKQRAEWKAASDKELEALAADSHLALLLAGRRAKTRFTLEEVL